MLELGSYAGDRQFTGIKNIRLDPTLPAFVSPNVLNYLVEHYNTALTTTAEKDLKAILG